VIATRLPDTTPGEMRGAAPEFRKPSPRRWRRTDSLSDPLNLAEFPRREHRFDLAQDRRAEDGRAQGLLCPLSAHFSRYGAPGLPAPEHIVRRVLRPQPSGRRRLADTHSGRCQEQQHRGRGFCDRGNTIRTRDLRVHLRERTSRPLVDFLAGWLWQGGAAARNARNLPNAALLARRQAAGVFDREWAGR